MLDTIFMNNGIFNHMGYGSFQYDKIIPIDQPMGAAMIFRRSILDDIGGAIDERFFIYYDDVDIAKRVKDKGFKTIFYPEAKIIVEGEILVRFHEKLFEIDHQVNSNSF